jgi:flagellin-like hook-associated protein FlgL
MGIAESLTSQIRGDRVASEQNIQQAQSMIQVADSALSRSATSCSGCASWRSPATATR